MGTKRVIALGFFDGIHIGHAALLRRTKERAAEIGAVPSALSFDVHPDTLVFGRDVPLTADILRDMGGDIPSAFAAEIPDSADAENFREHPEEYAVEYFLENYFGQKTRN